MANFTDCSNTYKSLSATERQKYSWNGPTYLVNNSDSIISYEGCLTLCTDKNQLYGWDLSSQTVLTWVLPVIGVLLQAPFESNAFKRTLFTVTRWVGSPMAALACILWNVSVSGKCAKMVDQAITTSYKKQTIDQRKHVSSIRDSFTILVNMNQFHINPDPSLDTVAQGLLRIALFSKDLPVMKNNMPMKLDQVRESLAYKLRVRRRRGVVPVFVSTAAFGFALAVSIQAAFVQVGDNTVAHDLALGLLLAWLPVLIMCSIIDRNPVAPDDIQATLNNFITRVADALADTATLDAYLTTVPKNHVEMVDRVRHISSALQNLPTEKKRSLDTNFFGAFSGQSRRRWHYGAARPILAGIESTNSFQDCGGRNWLQDESDARLDLVLGPPNQRLRSYDFHQLVQVITAFLIVTGCISGAFSLSFWTPTIGLGCRSFGYLIFICASFLLLVVEFGLWWLMDVGREDIPKRRWTWVEAAFRSFETMNTIWLGYCCLAQTFGWYRNCRCMSSIYSPALGGYIDLDAMDQATADKVFAFWRASIAITLSFMGSAMTYIVIQWMLQSHLTTEDGNKAQRGLQRVRIYRRILRFVTGSSVVAKKLRRQDTETLRRGSTYSAVANVPLEDLDLARTESAKGLLAAPQHPLIRRSTSLDFSEFDGASFETEEQPSPAVLLANTGREWDVSKASRVLTFSSHSDQQDKDNTD